MPKPTRTRLYITAALALLLLATPLSAGLITQVVVFGDSLSDNGNVYTLIGYPPPPYWNGRHSNGPVAVEYMAGQLGASLVNFAYDGATTGQGNVDDAGTVANRVGLPGMTAAFNDAFTANQIPLDPNAAYVVWGGPNDLNELTGPGDVPGLIGAAVTNLVTIAATLQALGATNIIVAGMPDPSLTPDVRDLDLIYPGFALLVHVAAMNFNAALQGNLPAGIEFFDSNAIFLSMVANPAAYGLTNVLDPCLVGNVVCANPDQYLFWDGKHPTTAVHGYMGSALAAAAVPEPRTWSVAIIGLFMIAAARARTRRR